MPPPPSTLQGRDLTTGSIPKHLIMFALPMLAGTFLQTAYAFINAIWVGQFLGKSAMAAVTVSFPVIFVLIAVGAGLTMATTVLIAQYYGAKNLTALHKVVQTSTLLLLTLGFVLFVVGEVFTPHILRAMSTPPEVQAMAESYMRIFLITMPTFFGTFLVRAALQGIGDSKTPLYFQVGSLVLNTILDPLLMFGLLGLPKLGLNGTAWASVIAQYLGMFALWFYLHRKKNLVSPEWSRLRGNWDWQTAWDIIRIGVPSAVQQALVAIGMLFVTGVINRFGETATAAFGAASRIDQIVFMPAMTFSMAVATLTGQNIGANALHRVRDVFKWGVILSGSVTLVGSVLAVGFSEMLLRIFIKDPAVIAEGSHYLDIVGPTYICFAVMFVSNGIMNGSGHTSVSTIVTLVSQWLFRVPMAFWLSDHLHNVQGVWYAIAFSFFVSTIVSLGFYFSGFWKRPVVRRQPVTASPESSFGDGAGEM